MSCGTNLNRGSREAAVQAVRWQRRGPCYPYSRAGQQLRRHLHLLPCTQLKVALRTLRYGKVECHSQEQALGILPTSSNFSGGPGSQRRDAVCDISSFLQTMTCLPQLSMGLSCLFNAVEPAKVTGKLEKMPFLRSAFRVKSTQPSVVCLLNADCMLVMGPSSG